MRRSLPGLVFLVLLALAGCGNATEPPVASELVLDPAELALVEGTTAPIDATVFDQFGQSMSVPVQWAIGPTSVATISPSGVVTAIAEGDALVSVTAPGLSETVPVTVVAPFEVRWASTFHESGYDTAEQRWECHYTLAATGAGGLGHEYATWEESEVQIRYVGGSSQTFTLTVVDMIDRFGAQTLSSGETQTTHRFAYHPNLEIEAVVYQMRHWIGAAGAGTLRSRAVWVDC